MLSILDFFINTGVTLVERFGYGGIFLTMALESAAIPIPSEVVVPLGGFNAALGAMNLWFVVIVATLANLAGSILLYFFGFLGGRPILERYGKYILIHKDDLEKLDKWLSRHEAGAVFFSRLLPGVRTFGSLVFGAGRAKFRPFVLLTFAGSFPWNFGLAYAGFILGESWTVVRDYFEKFETAIIILLVLAVIGFVLRHVRRGKKKGDSPYS